MTGQELKGQRKATPNHFGKLGLSHSHGSRQKPGAAGRVLRAASKRQERTCGPLRVSIERLREWAAGCLAPVMLI